MSTLGQNGNLNFGSVPVGSNATLALGLFPSGAYPFGITIYSFSISGTNAADFVVTDMPALPFTIAYNSHLTIHVKFTPTVNGAESATLEIDSNADNTPTDTSLSGTGTVSPALTTSYATTNDFGSNKVGVASSPLNVNLNNFGSSGSINVTGVAFNGPFSAGAGAPATPFTLLASNGSGTIQYPAVFTPTVKGFITQANAVVFTHSGTNSPTSVQFQGTGFIIQSAFILLGSGYAALFGFLLNSVPAVKLANPDSLNCEEACILDRLYDYDAPLTEKLLESVILRCEDLGTGAFTVTANSQRGNPVTTPAVSVGGTGDGKPRNAFADVQYSGDMIQVTINRAANSGPLSIQEIHHWVDPRGRVVERT